MLGVAGGSLELVKGACVCVGAHSLLEMCNLP